MTEAAEIVRHDGPAVYGDKLAEVMGGGDVMAMVGHVEANVRAISDIARKRGFITKFEQVNKKTGEVKVTEFFGLAAWQILGLVYGVTAVVEWVKQIDGGYHARAIAQTRDGMRVGAAEGLCHKSEPGKGYKADHDLAAVAQGRAERNALRSALGAILVLAGYDVPDPEAPATTDQIGMLHQLERDLGWTHDEGHGRAGVESYKDLTREGASTLIDAWGQEQTPPQSGQASDRSGGGSAESSAPEGPGPGATDPSPSEVDGPATKAQVERANALGLTDSAIVVKVRKLFPGVEPRDVGEVTRLQLAAVIKERMGP